jgi:hypothetical protein
MNSFTPIEVAIDEYGERHAELAELHAELESYKEFAGVCCGMACSCYNNLLIDIANKQTQLDALLLEIQLASTSLEQL